MASLLHPYLISYFQKFTDADTLYLHHRDIYDRIIHKRIANFPSYLGPIVFLVLLEINLDYRVRLTPSFINCFLTIQGGMIARTLEHSHVHDKFFEEYLLDPVHGGKYVLDGSKYALVARFLLDCFIQPCSEQEFFGQVVLLRKLSLKY